MSWQAIVMYCAVGIIGIPAAFYFWPIRIRNVTALALVVAWLVAEMIVYRTGNSLPLGFYFKADIAVIAVIYAKTIRRCGVKVYSRAGEQLRCLATDLTLWDRGIVAVFLLGMWPLYVLNFDAFDKWQALMWLAVAQFLLAGGEVVASFLAARRKKQKPPPIIDRHLVVIPFPVRVADAVRKPPDLGDMLIAKARGHG